MSVSLALLMAVTAALLAVAVCAVLWRTRGQQSDADDADPSDGIPKAQMTANVVGAHPLGRPPYIPPIGALLAAQLEVGQTFYIQTRNGKYTLTLRDPVHGLYDAVRVGPRRGDKPGEERFVMLFTGTFVPDYGLRFSEFVPGGSLTYQMIVGGETRERISTTVLRILSCIPESYRQAS